jgi:protein SCO1/2
MAGSDVGSALSLRVLLLGRGIWRYAIPLLAVLGGRAASAPEFALVAAGERWLPDVVVTTLEGEQHRLRELLQGKPAVLVPFYTRCPRTCALLIASWSQLARRLGTEQVRWLAFSFDPQERVEDLQRYRQQWDLAGWSLLRADSAAIHQLVQGLGIEVRRDTVMGVYEHPNVAVVVTPSGQVTRLILGLQPELEQVRITLWEARRGVAGLGVIEGFVLRCFRFDADRQRYVVDWAFLVQTCSGIVFVTGLLVWMVWEYRRGQRARAKLGRGGAADTGG